MKKCENCKKTFEGNFLFCPDCGAKLVDIKQEVPSVKETKKDIITEVKKEPNNDLPIYEQDEIKSNMKKISLMQRLKFLFLVIFVILLLVIPFMTSIKSGSTIKVFPLIAASVGTFIDNTNYIHPLNGGIYYVIVSIYALIVFIPALIILIKLQLKAKKGNYGQKEFYEKVSNNKNNTEAKYLRALEKYNFYHSASPETILIKGFYGLALIFLYIFIDNFVFHFFGEVNALIIIPILFLLAVIIFAIIELVMKNKLKGIINGKK